MDAITADLVSAGAVEERVNPQTRQRELRRAENPPAPIDPLANGPGGEAFKRHFEPAGGVGSRDS